MGLFDKLMTANGDASADYGRGGKHLGRLALMKFRDSDEPGNGELPDQFRVDIEVLYSSDPVNHPKGSVKTFNDNFKFIGSSTARMRRAIKNAKACATGEPVDEATFGLLRNDGESDKDFNARCVAEGKRLVGPTQPCLGAIVKIVAKEGTNQKTGTKYTLFELEVPTEADLVEAGLV